MIKINAFLLKLGTKQGCLLCPLLVKTALEVLASAIREEKKVNNTQVEKEEIKLVLFTGDNIVYVEISNN